MGRVCAHSRPMEKAPDSSPCLLAASAALSQPLPPNLLYSTSGLSEAHSVESQAVPSSPSLAAAHCQVSMKAASRA